MIYIVRSDCLLRYTSNLRRLQIYHNPPLFTESMLEEGQKTIPASNLKKKLCRGSFWRSYRSALLPLFMSLILAVYRSLWKFRKVIFICYGFGSLHGVLIRPITLERASRKALKCVMVMEKWLSKNWSSLAGEIRWNLACDIRLVLHIILPESWRFIFFSWSVRSGNILP